MSGLLVDSNVQLDVLTENPVRYRASAAHLEASAERRVPIINPIIYAEVSVGFDTIEALEDALPPGLFRREPLPWEAGFLAGKCFLRYHRRGGAHAAVRGHAILTRDASRYRTYFPTLEILGP